MVLEALRDIDGTPREIVVLNAGTALYAAGIAARSPKASSARATAIASGAAPRKLDEFVAAIDAEARRRKLTALSTTRWTTATSSRGSSTTKAEEVDRGAGRAAASPCVDARGARGAAAARLCGGAARQDRRRQAGGDRGDQEGEPEQGRAARRVRSGGDRRVLRARRRRVPVGADRPAVLPGRAGIPGRGARARARCRCCARNSSSTSTRSPNRARSAPTRSC